MTIESKKFFSFLFKLTVLKFWCVIQIAPNVEGLLLWGIVAVSAPVQNLIKETNFYFK